jgi:superfamily II DNA or RNA helicase
VTIAIDTLLRISDLKTITKGVEYFHKDRVYIYELGLQHACADVTGSGSNVYEVDLEFNDYDYRDVIEMHCTCPDFEERYDACKHIVATVLQVQQEAKNFGDDDFSLPSLIKQEKPKKSTRATDKAALDLLNRHAIRISKTVQTEIQDATAQATLEPTLHIDTHNDNDEITLSFKVGEKRLYVIKNLIPFKNGFGTSESMQFGKTYELILDKLSFTGSCVPLLEFFLRYFDPSDYVQRYGYYSYYSYYAPTQKTMKLKPVMLDSFFATVLGQKIFVENDKKKQNYLVSAGDVPVSLQLVKSGDGFLLKSESIFSIISGADFIYVFQDNTVYCCSKPFSDVCGELLKALASSHSGLYFSKTELPALLSSVLRDVEPYLDIAVTDGIEKYSPPPLETKVYFDVENGNVIAKMTFTYGDKMHTAFSNKTLTQSHELGAEIAAEQILQRYMSNRGIEPGTMILPGDLEQEIYELASHGIGEIQKFADVFVSEEFKKISVRPNPVVNVGVQVENNLLEVNFDIENIDFAEIAEILKSYKRAKKYHRLKDGSFLSLEDDGLSQLSELAEGLDIDEKHLKDGYAKFDVNRVLYVDSLLKNSEDIRFERDSSFKNIVKSMRDIADADFELPAKVDKILRNYQKTGYQWLRTIDYLNFGGILADDMGLGKTLEVLALLLAKKNEAKKDIPKNKNTPTSIVVCPASLILNWESEVSKFTPSLRVAALIGNAEEREGMIRKISSVDILITSYDGLRRDIHLYDSYEFEFVILDEAQFIKNQNTQKAKSVKMLKCKTRLALTGTPVENNLAELWSIFDFLMPGYLHNYSHFHKKYETAIVKDKNLTATNRLRALVRPFILRRLKGDVLKELPEKTESVHRMVMGDTQRKIYVGALAQAKEDLTQRLEDASGEAQGRMVVLAALTRMRQICCDPALIYDNYNGGSAKLDACMELIESSMESGHRMLLFSQFTSMMEIIAERLDELKIGYYVLNGSTPKQERQNLVNKFNSGTTEVFLISLKAGGTGLNLTGADVVIHYDPWWNVSAQNQATDRAHRIGQTQKVQVYKLIVKDTIEDRIMEMQERKAALADSIIQEGGNAFDTLSSDELLSLFEG